ncbi:MAG: TIGR00153 family protein [Pseudomonadota bacterium]|nr:TIGR00153 family protein [Pseudomonadota bacterium]
MAVKPAISDVISNSPLALLERHAGVCVDCVERLQLYFAEAQANRWGRDSDVREEICRFEGLADELKQDVRSNLPRGLWMSVSRADLLELVRVQDKMANGVKEVSGISLGRQLAFPAAMTSEVADFIDVVVQVSRVVVKIIGATRELSRSAFGTRQTNVILDFVSQVEADERRSDEMQAALRARLKEHEAELSAVDAIFLYQLLSAIGDIADNAEKVAHRAQIIATS